MIRWRQVNAIVLGYDEGGSSALGDPGSLSHDNANGWMSGVENVNGWGNLIVSDHSWPQITEIAEGETKDKGGTTLFTEIGDGRIRPTDQSSPTPNAESHKWMLLSPQQWE